MYWYVFRCFTDNVTARLASRWRKGEIFAAACKCIDTVVGYFGAEPKPSPSRQRKSQPKSLFRGVFWTVIHHISHWSNAAGRTRIGNVSDTEGADRG